MSSDAGWLPDPMGTHQVRYWDGARWTEHVSDGGTTTVDPLPADAPPPPPPVAAPPPPPPPPPPAATAPATGGGGWKDKLKSAAQQAATQGKQMAEQAKSTMADQQSKRTEQWANDPNTLWFGSSQGIGGAAMSKATYRITRDRVWIESGLLGTKSESVPLWSVKDLDVRQSLMQRGKDIGDVVLVLEDTSYGVDTGNAFSYSGMSEPGAHTTGQVVLDNIEGPYAVRELLLPLISEARQKKLMERQSQFIHHVTPGMAPGVPQAPAPAPAPAAPPVDLADQLRKLATLRDEGILSEEEFAAQKAKLLGS
jgi:hypothetical protein